MYYQLGFFLLTCFLAWRDGIFYRLRGKNNYTYSEEHKLQNAQHRLGIVIYALMFLIVIYAEKKIDYLLAVQVILIRLGFFDPVYNIVSKLGLNHIGTEAFFDRLSTKLLGKNAILIKTIIATVLLVASNTFLYEILKR